MVGNIESEGFWIRRSIYQTSDKIAGTVDRNVVDAWSLTRSTAKETNTNIGRMITIGYDWIGSVYECRSRKLIVSCDGKESVGSNDWSLNLRCIDTGTIGDCSAKSVLQFSEADLIQS